MCQHLKEKEQNIKGPMTMRHMSDWSCSKLNLNADWGNFPTSECVLGVAIELPKTLTSRLSFLNLNMNAMQ